MGSGVVDFSYFVIPCLYRHDLPMLDRHTGYLSCPYHMTVSNKGSVTWHCSESPDFSVGQ